jgi:hypothetical protein
MSRRQHTTLTLSIQVNLPFGESQKAFLERITKDLVVLLGSCIVKLTDKKVTYL